MGAYFCLKQLVGNSPKMKEEISNHVVKRLVKDLTSQGNCQNQDYASNAIMLLSYLTPVGNRQIFDAGWNEAYRTLIASKLAGIDVMRERIEFISKVSKSPKTDQ